MTQLIMGMARLGALVNFISHTVIVGFTAAAAVLIATNQIQHFFGLPIVGLYARESRAPDSPSFRPVVPGLDH